MRAVIDLGGTSIRYSVFDDGELVVEPETVPTGDPFKQIEDITREMKRAYNVKETAVVTTGTVSSNSVKRMSLDGNELEDLNPVVEDTSFLFENDTNAAALGESVYGAGKEFEDVLYVTMSTGISAGLVQGRDLIKGSGNFGKIGNYILKDEITWEQLCSGEKIPETYREFSDDHSDIETAEEVFELAERDREADKYLKEFLGRYNGMGLSDACVSYDPDVVILGGSVALENERVLRDLKPWFEKFFPDRYESPEVRMAGLGEDSELYGAGILSD